MRIRMLSLLAGVLVPLMFLGGCIFSPNKTEKKPPPPADYKKQTSPESVLVNLETAYVNKDAAAYDSLLYDADTAIDTLSTESYSFWFAQEDIGGTANIPPSWGRDDEMSSARGLFNSPNVETINIRLTYGPSYYDNTIGREGQKIINVTDVYLTVATHQNGAALTYLVQGQRSDFRFKVQWVDAEGDSLWRIIYWKDWANGAGKQSAPGVLASLAANRVHDLAAQARARVEAGAAVEPPRTRTLRGIMFDRTP